MPVYALLLVGAAVAAYAYHRDFQGAYHEHAERQTRIDALRNERDALANRRDALQRHVEGMQSDDIEIERAIRRNRNLVYEGEKIFRITLPDEAPDASAEDLSEQRRTPEP